MRTCPHCKNHISVVIAFRLPTCNETKGRNKGRRPNASDASPDEVKGLVRALGGINPTSRVLGLSRGPVHAWMHDKRRPAQVHVDAMRARLNAMITQADVGACRA